MAKILKFPWGSAPWLGVAGATLAALLAGCNLDPAVTVSKASSQKNEELPPIAIEAPPDTAIEERLSGIFHEMNGLGDVHVAVHQGVVHLSGMTETVSVEARAKTTAMRVDGVVAVESDMTQPSSPWGPLAPTGRAMRRLGHATLNFVPQALTALAVFLPFALLSSTLRRWRRPFGVFGMSSLSGHLLSLAIRLTLLLVGLLIVLDVLGLLGIVGAVVGALGVIGIVAGFVFKDWVSIYLPGILLGLHPPFKAGELVKIGAHEGRVVRITPSATVLVTGDAEEVRVPNAELFRTALVNFSRRRTRRLRFPLVLAPPADLAAAEELGCRALLGVRAIMEDPPPFMRVQGQGQDHVDVEFFAWVDQDKANFPNVESHAKRVVLKALLDNGVPLAALTLAIRPEQHAQAKDAGATREGGRWVPPDVAEAFDQTFLDQEFNRARAAKERDLLEEGSGSTDAGRHADPASEGERR